MATDGPGDCFRKCVTKKQKDEFDCERVIRRDLPDHGECHDSGYDAGLKPGNKDKYEYVHHNVVHANLSAGTYVLFNGRQVQLGGDWENGFEGAIHARIGHSGGCFATVGYREMCQPDGSLYEPPRWERDIDKNKVSVPDCVDCGSGNNAEPTVGN